MPFHTVDSEEEAESLIVLFCAYNSMRKCYQIRASWNDQDIEGAIAEARRHFRLTIEE